MRVLAAVAVGLGSVGLATGWTEAYPARPILIVAEAGTYRSGPVARGTFGRHPWEIRNVGPRPVRLRTHFTSGRSGFSLWQGMTHVVEPGRSLLVHLTYPVPSDPAHPFDALAILRTDDPDRPEIRLRVVGTSDR